jgi:hypothetical protein
MLGSGQSSPELCLVENQRPLPGFQPHPVQAPEPGSQQPLWKSVEGERLVLSPVAAHGGDLFFLSFKRSPENNAPTADAQMLGGLTPRLVCFHRGSSEPRLIPLVVANDAARLPQSPSKPPPRYAPTGWLVFGGDYLFLELPGFAGFWRVPVKAVESAAAEVQ